MGIGTLALRLVVGGAFIGHGLQKLTGAFDGPGLSGTEKMMEAQNMRPAPANARLVALTETLGGAAIAVGAATPFAATGLIAAMTTAVRKVHANNGFFTTKGGYEYNAVLIAALTAIAGEGPGAVSIDAALGRKRWGSGWAIGALAAGVAASFAVVEIGRRGGISGFEGLAEATAEASAPDDEEPHEASAGEPIGSGVGGEFPENGTDSATDR
jgi:putative oxidoreductase